MLNNSENLQMQFNEIINSNLSEGDSRYESFINIVIRKNKMIRDNYVHSKTMPIDKKSQEQLDNELRIKLKMQIEFEKQKVIHSENHRKAHSEMSGMFPTMSVRQSLASFNNTVFSQTHQLNGLHGGLQGFKSFKRKLNSKRKRNKSMSFKSYHYAKSAQAQSLLPDLFIMRNQPRYSYGAMKKVDTGESSS